MRVGDLIILDRGQRASAATVAVRTEDWRAPWRWSGSRSRASAAAARALGRHTPDAPSAAAALGVVFHEAVAETQQPPPPPTCRSAPPPASPPSQVSAASAAASAAPAATHPARLNPYRFAPARPHTSAVCRPPASRVSAAHALLLTEAALIHTKSSKAHFYTVTMTI